MIKDYGTELEKICAINLKMIIRIKSYSRKQNSFLKFIRIKLISFSCSMIAIQWKASHGVTLSRTSRISWNWWAHKSISRRFHLLNLIKHRKLYFKKKVLKKILVKGYFLKVEDKILIILFIRQTVFANQIWKNTIKLLFFWLQKVLTNILNLG